MNNLEIIEQIIKNSADFAVENIFYEILSDRVMIWSNQRSDKFSKEFFSTDIVLYLSSFTKFFAFNEQKNQVVLIVY